MNLLPGKKYGIHSRNFVKKIVCAKKKVSKLSIFDVTQIGFVKTRGRKSHTLAPLIRNIYPPPFHRRWADNFTDYIYVGLLIFIPCRRPLTEEHGLKKGGGGRSLIFRRGGERKGRVWNK